MTSIKSQIYNQSTSNSTHDLNPNQKDIEVEAKTLRIQTLSQIKAQAFH